MYPPASKSLSVAGRREEEAREREARESEYKIMLSQVLNTAQMFGRHALHPKLLARLRALVERTNCKIVLSTTWRLAPENERVLLRAPPPRENRLCAQRGAGVPERVEAGPTEPSIPAQALELAGIPASTIVDRTPNLGPSALVWRGGKNIGECRRATEIARFLETRPAYAAAPYAVVDDLDVLAADDPDVVARLRGHFARTDVSAGLTQAACDKLVEMLGDARPPPGG